MDKRFTKFKYQLVDSTQEGYREVLVTYCFKDRPCHYYSFIRMYPGMKLTDYINEAKRDVNEKINNGDMVKKAKRYLNYEVKKVEEKKKPVEVKRKVKPKKKHKKREWVPYFFLIILGLLFIAGAVLSYLYHYQVSHWTKTPVTDQEKFLSQVCLYLSIAEGVLGITSLGFGIPLFISKLRKHKKK